MVFAQGREIQRGFRLNKRCIIRMENIRQGADLGNDLRFAQAGMLEITQAKPFAQARIQADIARIVKQV